MQAFMRQRNCYLGQCSTSYYGYDLKYIGTYNGPINNDYTSRWTDYSPYQYGNSYGYSNGNSYYPSNSYNSYNNYYAAFRDRSSSV
uniref:Uncharacterized protein n=1 Tax=Ditylenchus dipsaci TaxID=166011 RepID=A0A915E3R6_9BILA